MPFKVQGQSNLFARMRKRDWILLETSKPLVGRSKGETVALKDLSLR